MTWLNWFYIKILKIAVPHHVDVECRMVAPFPPPPHANTDIVNSILLLYPPRPLLEQLLHWRLCALILFLKCTWTYSQVHALCLSFCGLLDICLIHWLNESTRPPLNLDFNSSFPIPHSQLERRQDDLCLYATQQNNPNPHAPPTPTSGTIQESRA